MMISRDEDGEPFEVTKDDVLDVIGEVTKMLYFEYMISSNYPKFESFKKDRITSYAQTLDLIHDTYADHVEGKIKEIRGLNG